MVALILCGLAFGVSFVAGRRSLVAGIAAALAVGYFYGILRANVLSALSHFIFDAGLMGLYLARLTRLTHADRTRNRQLVFWLVPLIGWPLLLLLLPTQDPMVRLVGLRAQIFFLPVLVLGARLDRDELYRLALCIAGLNLVAFTFGVAEFFLGVERFYPRSPVTELIYRSNDIFTGSFIGAFRIPAVFANSSAYGGVMVMTLPLLLGAWIQRKRTWHAPLLTLALGATVLGVFMAASRSHFMVLVVLLAVSSLSGRLGVAGRVAWLFLLGGLGWVVAAEGRLFQRFMSISPEAILGRIAVSVNHTFIDLLFRYPMGNGLGGGGSSMPYFLMPLVRNPIAIENQYGAILMEQGLPGLLVWWGFLAWVVTRPGPPRRDPWHLGRRLAWFACAAYFAQGLIGVGMLTSVPFTMLLLLNAGWLASGKAAPVPVHEPVRTAAPPLPVPGPRRPLHA